MLGLWVFLALWLSSGAIWLLVSWFNTRSVPETESSRYTRWARLLSDTHRLEVELGIRDKDDPVPDSYEIDGMVWRTSSKPAPLKIPETVRDQFVGSFSGRSLNGGTVLVKEPVSLDLSPYFRSSDYYSRRYRARSGFHKTETARQELSRLEKHITSLLDNKIVDWRGLQPLVEKHSELAREVRELERREDIMIQVRQRKPDEGPDYIVQDLARRNPW